MDACQHLLREPLPEGHDPQETIRLFKQAINMSKDELEAFLASRPSQEAAQDLRGDEADHDGRHLARRVIELLDKDDGTGEPYWDADYAHMRQVARYIDCHRRLLAEQGGGDREALHRLRCLLMNYGYDPAKEAAAAPAAGA